jgi:hypothetical protein
MILYRKYIEWIFTSANIENRDFQKNNIYKNKYHICNTSHQSEDIKVNREFLSEIMIMKANYILIVFHVYE